MVRQIIGCLSQAVLIALLLHAGSSVLAQAPSKPKESRVTLAPGPPPSVHKDVVVGYDDVSYTFAGKKGQTLVVDLQTTSTSLYFNLLPAGSQEAVYSSDRGETGNKASIDLPADGDYRVTVYLFRNAARRGTKAAFSLSLALK